LEGPLTPRKRRFTPAGYTFHVTNRGNDRRRIFFEDADYQEFLRLLVVAKYRYPVRLHGLCVMPNHFHGLLRPESDCALSAYLQWVESRYACDLRVLTQTVGYGHVFQKRFWSDGIEDERHFLSVLRYVEANPVRARLVRRAEEWPWSSLALRVDGDDRLCDPLPYQLPADWLDIVNSPQSLIELERIRTTERRGRPVAALTVTPSKDGN
jgi:putative transposase